MPNLIKRRRPWVAVVFSLFMPGLGQIYNGQFVKAVIIFSLNVLLLSLVFFLAIPYSFIFLGSWFICVLLLTLYNLTDAFSVARRSNDYSLKQYNRWYIYLSLYCAFMFFAPSVSDVRENYLETFKIPSSAMAPSIVPGDCVLVDKRSYHSHPPRRGDVVVFRGPDDPKKLNVIKRIVAVGGDTIEIKEVSLLLNGKLFVEDYAKWIYGGAKDFGPVTVPVGKLFLLGDNRDESRDSRYWQDPFLDQASALGKVMFIYWPWRRMGKPVS